MFVTNLKHHLQYHIKTHSQIKPFKCGKCKYACANNSMLNSHMKYVFKDFHTVFRMLYRSHTLAYPYQCRDCTYQTKYSHSLKIHMKTYNHHCIPQQKPDNVISNKI